ncbi:MAG TPA: right-handed parallel beta-helix repeat-containing protein [Kofleriaceae bacterium]|nr:right-handed parallel beta-helix repeat-containing protein [Kofleriaceae bacterium]
MNTTRLLSTALLLLAAPPAARADTIKVPQDHSTIQAAIDASLDGDVIEIKGGKYEESITIANKTNVQIIGKGKVTLLPPGLGPGFSMSGCTGCTVEKIRLSGAAGSGFELTGCTGGSLLDCRAEDVLGDGIRLDDCDGVTIDGCFVKFSGLAGVALATGTDTPTDNCTVSGCKILDSFGDGVSVNGSGNTITGNTITKTLGLAIQIDATTPGAGNHLTGNKIKKVDDEAILVTGSDTEVADNSVSLGNSEGIVVLAGTGHSVTGNKVNKVVGNGVLIGLLAPGATVSDNTISNVLDDGIDARGDDAVCEDNTIKGPAESGFEITGDAGTYTGNLVKGAKGDGFLIFSGDNVLTFNTAKGSKGFDLNDLGIGNSIDDTNNFKKVAP